MSLLVVKGNIVAALPMKGWYVCTYNYVYFIQHTNTTPTATTQCKCWRVCLQGQTYAVYIL